MGPKKNKTKKKILVSGDEVTELSQKGGLNSSTIQDISVDLSEINGGATGTGDGGAAADSSFVFGT